MANKTETFEEKVKAMSAKELIMAMVNGLRNPAVNVDMHSWGTVSDGICYGCAATNAICAISGIAFTPKNIKEISDRARAVNSEVYFLDRFEAAINFLRCGAVFYYNRIAERIGISEIIKPEDVELPFLETDNYLDNLEPYVRFAEAQGE